MVWVGLKLCSETISLNYDRKQETERRLFSLSPFSAVWGIYCLAESAYQRNANEVCEKH